MKSPSFLSKITLLCVALMGFAKANPDETSAAEIIIQAHEALGDMLHTQAQIRSDTDLENFKKKSSEILGRMKKLAEKVPKAKEPTNFERREVYGIAMRYRYELFPPVADGDPYLKNVPVKYHEELRQIAAAQPPELANLWKYITEVTMPIEEDGFVIPIGTEKIDGNLSVMVSLGRREERPKLAISPSSGKSKFEEGPEYIDISVEGSKDEGGAILYNQKFPVPDGFDEIKFEISDAVKIDKEKRILSVIIPGVEHSYRLPNRR